jgi:6-pyruvoyltetrahydropterin/6-carboxytetrahydropterin synthase
MYRVQKTMEVSACHSLQLGYESKCKGLHGHNWTIVLYCQAETLNSDGMVEDFTRIKQSIHDRLDHRHLNEVLEFNPTAENIARWCVEQVKTAYRCDVQESSGNIATYEK